MGAVNGSGRVDLCSDAWARPARRVVPICGVKGTARRSPIFLVLAMPNRWVFLVTGAVNGSGRVDLRVGTLLWPAKRVVGV